jgi:hypothetical protein
VAELITCPTCGTANQEVGKFCEQCGAKVEPATVEPVPASGTGGNGSTVGTDGGNRKGGGNGSGNGSGDTTLQFARPNDIGASAPTMRFIRVENGVFNRDQAFDVPVGADLLVGRTDPMNGIFPEVDVTMWSQRVQTPDGALYTVHRKQCVISRDQDGKIWIRDYPDYIGDTMLSPAGTSQFHPLPSLKEQRESKDDGATIVEPGDRILMGQGEGMLIFQLLEVS